ncbi:Transmembrane nucleoporin [Coemansia thaxteri]|uniref:Transmembrane nucleoporin n=1 Tax=Coemansia thaxteri TaxID=2663907 RepID=A0A9W8BLF7_9FUNG|nr:Transmembrane nucleoporin [Coemansia thaxteri]KAJ2005546.1 Transmembrane nucleoporin [Coemansia thaxteri]KAJ2470420.1 Transmembrane nucleoporin [Coemansia sp. RSA 2322]KAJ2475076.1 Transmembrane nucleoporin [Coemansia sp. RSA 2320]
MALPANQRASSGAARSSSTASERLAALTKTAQFYWWVGHMVVLLFGTMYYLKRPFGWKEANWYYSKAYLGALTSYAIVIYKTYGPPQLNLAFVQRLVVDENVEYLLLAFCWYWYRPIVVTLLPFVVFSLFHVITYTRSSLIPLFFPDVAGEIQRARQGEAAGNAASGLSVPARVSKFMGDWSSKYYSPALREVGVWEVAVIGVWLVLGAVTFQTPLLAPLGYFQFLRLRYALSAPTRAAFRRVRVLLDRLLTPPAAHPSVPAVATDLYIKARDYLARMGSMITDPAAAAAAAQQQ